MSDPTTDDRLMVAIRELVRSQFPQLDYMCARDYVVISGGPSTVDVTPADPSGPFPPLKGVPLVPTTGSSCTPTPGSKCVVMFLDADPTRPVCWSLDSAPLLTSLGEGVLPIARATDPVVAGPFAGTIIGPGNLKVYG